MELKNGQNYKLLGYTNFVPSLFSHFSLSFLYLYSASITICRPSSRFCMPMFFNNLNTALLYSSLQRASSSSSLDLCVFLLPYFQMMLSHQLHLCLVIWVVFPPHWISLQVELLCCPQLFPLSFLVAFW